MAIKVKDITKSTAKWAENAARAAAEYTEQAAAAAELWATEAARGADNFFSAVTAAGIKERFRAGVVRAGASKFRRKILDVGGGRFGPGVAAATDDYKTDVSPFFETIAALTLSARKPRGDPANYIRSQEVGKALHAKRLALLGAGR